MKHPERLVWICSHVSHRSRRPNSRLSGRTTYGMRYVDLGQRPSLILLPRPQPIEALRSRQKASNLHLEPLPIPPRRDQHSGRPSRIRGAQHRHPHQCHTHACSYVFPIFFGVSYQESSRSGWLAKSLREWATTAALLLSMPCRKFLSHFHISQFADGPEQPAGVPQ